MSKLERFTGLYPVSKTLRFELKPVGRTLEHIQHADILREDEHRAESYREVKKIIDRYHKHFIEEAFGRLLNSESEQRIQEKLHEFYELYQLTKRSKKDNDALDEIKTELRKLVVLALTGGSGKNQDNEQSERYKNLFDKALFSNILPDFVTSEEDRALLREFDGFTSYFVGFYENRRNMYSEEPQATAIAYRLIHENLPKFIDNIRIFQRVKEPLQKEIEEVYGTFADGGYMNVRTLDEIFSIEYFTHVFSQEGIELYNTVIGKIVTADGTELKGLNERINLYNQQQPGRETRLPLFKPLYKQILSDREQLSWLPESFTSDNELLESLIGKGEEQGFCDYIVADILERVNLLMQSIASYDLSRIFLKNDPQLTNISKRVYGEWNAINEARERAYDSVNSSAKKGAKYVKTRESLLAQARSLSIASIRDLWPEDNEDKIIDYFAGLGEREYPDGTTSNVIDSIYSAHRKLEEQLQLPMEEDDNLIQDKEKVAQIKELLDNICDLQRFLKPLLGNGDESDKDEQFYGELNYIMTKLDQAIPLYNKVRNYLTRKPYSTEKIKLNFGNAKLLDGWDRNKETDNTCVILRKDGNFYLAIMHKKHNKLFESKELPRQGTCYEKMDYKLLPGPNKMLPKVFFSQKGIERFAPSQELLERYKRGTHKKGDNFDINHLRTLIDFFKDSINVHEDWRHFGFQFSDTDSYADISGFYKEVADQGYKLSFRPVSESYIHSLVEEGKLYLFQIYNKDFSPFSKGTPNIHTLYWRMLFDERNLADVVYKLNGQAEIFYRKKSLKSTTPTHPANRPIRKKSAQHRGEESLFTYDLIKDRRYTVDKFQFHVPITMNFKSAAGNRVNTMVNTHIKETKDMHVIGIDRGERNLLYVCVVDSRGKILEQFSLNTISETDYHSLLEERDAQRQQERRNWQTIEGIKDLKQGYLSQVVHRITQLMVEHQAIIALEDLNMGFKRGRQKVESSVYQQFEKQLIDKLNYLVDKKKEDPCQAGGLLKAYQFTEPFVSFEKMGKQNGLLFYVPAWNTSKIDPTTGFVNLFDTRYKSVSEAKTFFSKFDTIRYNPQANYFEFSCDYNDFGDRARGSRTKWTLCSYGPRIRTFRNPQKNNQWDSQEIDLTTAFRELFAQHSIDYTKDLQAAILAQDSKDFFAALLELFKLMVQLRNSKKETGEDYLISPIANADGHFFDSREGDDTLPKDADANGAYNIALKGLWALRQIRMTEEGQKTRLAITNKEWLDFVQNKRYLED